VPDFTHDAARRSWLDAANRPTDFPLQNLPFGVFRVRDDEIARVGIAIGDAILDLGRAHEAGLFAGDALAAADACVGHSLNPLLALARPARQALRHRVSRLLGPEATGVEREAVAALLVPRADVRMELPVAIGDYTDFYASIHHATNVGRMLRPEHPLLPNYKWVPIGYHGRASSVVVSGTEIARPRGQRLLPGAEAPTFGPSGRLDYELEIGAYVSGGNSLGHPIPIDRAREHLFGLCLVNDWSARDLQAWEYQPLGPFLSKSFATTVSPWVVTADALEPYRVAMPPRPAGDPPPLPYLDSAQEREAGAYDIALEVWLRTAAMRAQGLPPVRVSLSHARDLYWSFPQLITHHTSNGCNLRPGDLLASGTVSGSAPEARASLLELTWQGAHPLPLPTGEQRRFLEDGDEVVFRGRVPATGGATMGFGECRGLVRAPAS
jgi:fumarylacetoacetase